MNYWLLFGNYLLYCYYVLLVILLFLYGIFLIVIIHLYAVVGETIAHHEIVDVEKEVVCGNLLKHLLCDNHRRSLVFNNHAWLKAWVVENAVAPEVFLANRQFHLVGQKSFRVALVFYEEVYKMLSHPFFGSECNMSAAKKVEYGEAFAVALY